MLPTMLGIPLGLMLLSAAAEAFVKGILAAVIVAFSAHSLLGGKHRELKNDNFAWLFGFGAGILGGAYGMNGPPLVIYGSLRRWTPQHFRATLQAYFLPGRALRAYWVTGLLACGRLLHTESTCFLYLASSRLPYWGGGSTVEWAAITS